jgi:O-antigen ligase
MNNNMPCNSKWRTFLEFLLVGFFVSLVFIHYVIPKSFRTLYLVVGLLFFVPVYFSSIFEKKSYLWSILSRFFAFYLLFVAFFCLRTHYSEHPEYRDNIYFKKVFLSFLLYAPHAVVGIHLSFHKKSVLGWLGLIFLCYMPIVSILFRPNYPGGGILMGTHYTYQGLGFITGISGLSVICLLGAFNKCKWKKCCEAIRLVLICSLYVAILFLLDRIGGRSAFGAYMLGTVVFLFCYLNHSRVLVSFSVLLLILLSILPIVNMVRENKRGGVSRIKYLFQQKGMPPLMLGNHQFVNDPSYRKTLFSQALKLWVSSPKSFFVGVGVGGFQWYYKYLPDFQMYPHNFILELLCETGILGTLLFAGMLFWPYCKAKEYYGCSQEGITSLYPLLAFQFFVSMFTGGLISLFVFFALFFASLPCPSQKEIN